MDLKRFKSLDTIAEKASWSLAKDPIMVPSLDSEGDNIYAPCVIFDSHYKMWYGGQASDGHDRIHHATSKDGINWLKHGVVVDNGSSEHVNDPSVVKTGKGYFMYYSDAGDDKCIHLAHSFGGEKWQTIGCVLGTSAGGWDSAEVARPSVLYEGGVFKLWYDGSDGKNKRAGYAVSEDGLNFEKIGPVLDHAGAVNVQHIRDKYFMLFESGEGTWIATGDNETGFGDKRLLIPKSGHENDAFGHVTPYLFHHDSRTAIFLGMATIKQWCRNRIGLAVLR